MTITEQAAHPGRWERRERWVASMGGRDSPQYRALYTEAYDFAGPDGLTNYMDMAMELDEEHAAHKRGRAVARLRAAVDRRRLNAAAGAALQQANAIQLAAESLFNDPRLAADPDFASGPERSRAEIEADARYAMGLANRAPAAYMTSLPAVGDLARAIGLRS